MSNDKDVTQSSAEATLASWLEDDTNFIALMVGVASVIALCGLCFFICVCRFPSYDYPENFERDRRLRRKNKDADLVTKADLEQDGRLEPLPVTDTTFQAPTGASRLRTAAAPSLRLPTPGDAQQPAGRLPPLEPPGVVAEGVVIASANVSARSSRVMLVDNDVLSMAALSARGTEPITGYEDPQVLHQCRW